MNVRNFNAQWHSPNGSSGLLSQLHRGLAHRAPQKSFRDSPTLFLKPRSSPEDKRAVLISSFRMPPGLPRGHETMFS